MISPLVVGLTVPILVYVLIKHFPRSSLSNIRGPKSQSFILGNLLELFQRPVGETDFEWHNQYGNIVRFKGVFGESQLLITDPKAVQKILNISVYDYQRLPNLRAITRTIIGRGIVWSDGEDHKRHRNVMAPGFGQRETKEFLPLFKECAAMISTKWLEIIGSNDGQNVVQDVRFWLSHAALHAITQVLFDVQFDSIRDDSHPLVKECEDYLVEVYGLPSAVQVFIQVASRHVPMWMLHWITDRSSNSRVARARDVKRAATDFAKELLRGKEEGLLQAKDNRDILTLLVRANMDTKAKNKLTEEELLAQMSTLLIGGHETTATSTSFILLELARNPKVQSKLRDEIRKTEAGIQARSDPHITVADLDSMPYLNAVIKEGLRLHPAVPHIWRLATRDDILPLSKPVRAESGNLIDEVHVPKGTQIVVSIAAYNRDKDIWGDDAHKFTPDRWLDGTVNEKKSTGVGVYSNLLTLSSGARSCLGWRFAILELQVFLFELVGKFEFGKTDKTDHILRQFAIVMLPMVEGELDRGTQLPLAVSLAPQDSHP